MTNRFLMSVAAAALIAGTGFAYAQGTGTSREAPGSTAQQSAPSSSPSSATPMNRESDKGAPGAKTTQTDKAAPGAKTTQTEEKAQPGGAKNQRAQDDMKAAPKGERSAEDGNLKGERSKTTETDTKGTKDMKGENRGNMNAQGREDRLNAQGREDRMNAQGREERRGSETTTGQVGASAKLSTEQRTRISSVIREQHVQAVTHVDFDIRPGIRVPRSGVSFHPLPPDIVTIYPEWRGYEYFLVNNQIVVVNPRTLEIVDVIDV
jgi:Protein of unknown function (DUF1236)